MKIYTLSNFIRMEATFEPNSSISLFIYVIYNYVYVYSKFITLLYFILLSLDNTQLCLPVLYPVGN